MSDRAALRTVLKALSNDREVDWDAARSGAAHEQSRQLLEELRVIARISAVHASVPATPNGARVIPFRPGPDAIWGRLQVRALLAAGADGDVYRAHDEQLHRDVALKLLRRAPNDRSVTHALDEARLLARVRHPNVVTVHGADIVNGQAGIWMELLEGDTLHSLVAKQGPFGAEEAAVIGAEICRGLSAIHHAGIVHRDLKAQNVMRELGGRIVVMDFSASRADSSRHQGLAGTPLYIAPELFAGHAASPRSDIYSVGVLLFYLVTGKYPVTGTTVADVALAHDSSRATRLRDARADLPAGFIAVVDRALAFDPGLRPATAGELEQELLASVTQRPTAPIRATRSRRWAMGLAAAALLLTAVAGWRSWPAEPSPAAVPLAARPWVLVASFDNRTGRAELDGVLEHALERELIGSSQVRVASRPRVDDALRLMQRPIEARLDLATAREIALRDGGIATVLGGRLELVGTTTVLSASILDVSSGAPVATVSEEATGPNDLQPAVRRLASRLRAALGEATGAIQSSTAQLERVTTPSLTALRLYSGAYDAGSRNEWAAALPLARAAVAADPSFAAAHTWLAWALMRNRAPTDEYLPSAEEGVRLSVNTSDWERLWIRGSYESLSGETTRALGSYDAVLRLYPEHFWAANNFVRGNIALGYDAQAVTAALRLLELQPRDYNSLYLVLDLFRRLGRLNEAAEIAARIRTSEGSNSNPSGDAWVFDVFLAWHKGDAAATVRELQRIQSDALQLRPELQHAVLARSALIWLAIGRPADAEQGLLGAGPSADTHLTRATIAHAAGNDATVRREVALADVGHLADGDSVGVHARHWSTAMWLAARTAKPAAVRQLFATIESIASQRTAPFVPATVDKLAGEVALAEGAIQESIRRLSPDTWNLTGDGVNFRAAETLAEARVRDGDLAGAIRVLEPIRQLKHRAAYDKPYWWMRCQLRLAELYQQAGRTAEATGIARELDAGLKEAEPGFPMAARVRAILDYGLAAK